MDPMHSSWNSFTYGQRTFLTCIFLGKSFGIFPSLFLVAHLSWCALNLATILLPYHSGCRWKAQPTSHLNSDEPGNNSSFIATILHHFLPYLIHLHMSGLLFFETAPEDCHHFFASFFVEKVSHHQQDCDDLLQLLQGYILFLILLGCWPVYGMVIFWTCSWTQQVYLAGFLSSYFSVRLHLQLAIPSFRLGCLL